MFKEEEEHESPMTSGSSSVEEVEAIQQRTTEVRTALETTGASQSQSPTTPKKAARKLYDEEKRAVGRIARNIWLMYFRACGSWLFWGPFVLIFVLGSTSAIFNNGWLRWIQHHLARTLTNRNPVSGHLPLMRALVH